MRENRLAVLCALLTALVVLGSGCAQAQQQGTGQTTALEEGQTQLYGKVVSIVGNDLTLAVGEMQESSDGEPGQAQPSARQSSTGENGPGEDDAQLGEGRQAADFAAGKTGEPPDSEAAQTPPQDREGPDGERGGMGQGGDQLQLTGEELELTIPVGTPVTRAMSSSLRSLDFTAIREENTLRLVMEDAGAAGQRLVSIEILG